MNRFFLSAFFLAVAVESYGGVGESERAAVLAHKSALIRPAVTADLPFDKRSGFTAAESEFYKKRFSAAEFTRIEATAVEFWSIPLLSAMAAMTTYSESVNVPPADEWITESSENILRNILPHSLNGQTVPIRLTYLSESGFVRVEKSVEVAPVDGRDVIGEIPAANFCARSPGTEVPSNFSFQFAPWEVGSRLASSSRLEMSLLDLVMRPDPLDYELGVTKGAASSNVDSAPSRAAMQRVLDGLSDRLKKNTVSVGEFLALSRRDPDVGQKSRRLMTAAAVSAETLRKKCLKDGYEWSEIRWDKDDWLEIFACRDKKGKQSGPIFRVKDGDFETGELSLTAVAGALFIEAGLKAEHDEFITRYVDHIGANIRKTWFFGDGRVRAQSHHEKESSKIHVFYASGTLAGVTGLDHDRKYSNISWHADGSPSSFEWREKDGVKSLIAGFHQNGEPKFLFPMNDGKADGKFMWWHKSGRVAGELAFVSDRRFGPGALYYQNGIAGFSAEYAEGVPHGRSVWRDPSGRSLFSLGFRSGKPHGLMEIRHGGRIIAEARFSGGTVEGNIVMRNRYGLNVAEIPYKGGMLSGTVILRDEKGNIRVTSEWLDGKVHGKTEVNYGSGRQASVCSFDQGHLMEWSSLTPKGSKRFEGKAVAHARNRYTVDFYGGTAESVLRCVADDSQIENCVAIRQGKSIQVPGLRELVAVVPKSVESRFIPGRCGGWTRSFDVSPFTDQSTGQVAITYRAKERCAAKDLATGLHCTIDLIDSRWSNPACTLSDDDFDDDSVD